MDSKKERDMTYSYLIGNLNRMCVTSDAEELDKMYQFAKKRLDNLYRGNRERLEETKRLQKLLEGVR